MDFLFIFSLNQKYDDSYDLLESLLLSNVDCNEDNDAYQEYNLDYFLIYEQSYQVYFNRLR
jgi:hypothetical protein